LLLARLTLARPSVSNTIWMRPQSPLCCAFSAVRIACARPRGTAHAAREAARAWRGAGSQRFELYAARMQAMRRSGRALRGWRAALCRASV